MQDLELLKDANGDNMLATHQFCTALMQSVRFARSKSWLDLKTIAQGSSQPDSSVVTEAEREKTLVLAPLLQIMQEFEHRWREDFVKPNSPMHNAAFDGFQQLRQGSSQAYLQHSLLELSVLDRMLWVLEKGEDEQLGEPRQFACQEYSKSVVGSPELAEMQRKTQVDWVETLREFCNGFRMCLDRPSSSSSTPFDSTQHESVIAETLTARHQLHDLMRGQNYAAQNFIRSAMGLRALMLGPPRHGDENKTLWNRFTDLVTGTTHDSWEDAEFLMTLYGAAAVSPLTLLFFNWRPGGNAIKKISLGKLVQAMQSPYLGRGDSALHSVEYDCWHVISRLILNGPAAYDTIMPSLVDKWEKLLSCVNPEPRTIAITAKIWDELVKETKKTRKAIMGASTALKEEARKKKNKPKFQPSGTRLDHFLKEKAIAAIRDPDPEPVAPAPAPAPQPTAESSTRVLRTAEERKAPTLHPSLVEAVATLSRKRKRMTKSSKGKKVARMEEEEEEEAEEEEEEEEEEPEEEEAVGGPAKEADKVEGEGEGEAATAATDKEKPEEGEQEGEGGQRVEEKAPGGVVDRPDAEMDLGGDGTRQEPPTQAENGEGQPPDSSQEETEERRAGSPPAQTQEAEEPTPESSPDRMELVDEPKRSPAQTQEAEEQSPESSPDRMELVDELEVSRAEKDTLMRELERPKAELRFGKDDSSQQPPSEEENADDQQPDASSDQEVPPIHMYAPPSDLEEPEVARDLGEDAT
ncbi:hypothetical protein BD410DRAFT_903316, partial [Rickenella mellea]